jgi:excisionase family DNA binding protein
VGGGYIANATERRETPYVTDPRLMMEDVAERLRVSKGMVATWIQRGDLTGKRLPGGRLWRIRESALEAWIEGQSE